eukprot:1126221-Amphidinium_carterae.1
MISKEDIVQQRARERDVQLIFLPHRVVATRTVLTPHNDEAVPEGAAVINTLKGKMVAPTWLPTLCESGWLYSPEAKETHHSGYKGLIPFWTHDPVSKLDKKEGQAYRLGRQAWNQVSSGVVKIMMDNPSEEYRQILKLKCRRERRHRYLKLES